MTPFILDTDEHVIRIVRKSIILFCLQVIGFVFVSILPVFLLSFGIKYFELSFSDSTQQIVRVILATWILFVWVSLFIRFTNYYLDSWVITNKRIVDIDQKSLFTRTTRNAKLGQNTRRESRSRRTSANSAWDRNYTHTNSRIRNSFRYSRCIFSRRSENYNNKSLPQRAS
jgi:hypothetical protein